MTHWKLTLAYDGTLFHGWQIQPGLRTVQGTLAEAIRSLTNHSVLPQGAGRTDAGVHALGQVASFSLPIALPAENLQRALNRILPPSVRVLRIEPVSESFHARHRARSKTYEYRLFERRRSTAHNASEHICPPFQAPYVWDCRWPLDLDAMLRAASLLCGTHDFTSFRASDPERSLRGLSASDAPSPGPGPVKTIYSSHLLREHGLLIYRVCGSGFLHHMVRNIVGTLVEVGRGALAPTDIPAILAAQDRSAAGPTAPPQGLYLVHVDYEAVP